MTVGIVGLGIAGIRTALLLEEAGIDVRLYEARDRIGGRVLTIDDGSGLVYEAGGEWIQPDHHRCQALMRELGLEPNLRGHWPRTIVYRGTRCSEDLLWADALEDELRVEAAAREICRNLNPPAWSNDHAADLDAHTIDDFIREHTQSERGLWWVGAKVRERQGEDPDTLGALSWLMGCIRSAGREPDDAGGFRFPHGASDACARMIARLRTEVRFGSVLRRVSQSSSGVRLQFDSDAETVDRAVLTLPPPVLEQVVIEPALSVAKRCAIEACEMGRAIRICWEFDRPWWIDEGWTGSLLCDGPLQRLWEATLGERPVLSATIYGDEATRWTDLGDPVRAGLYELSEMFPVARDHFVLGRSYDWIADPRARGGSSVQRPGYVLEHMRNMSSPENLIHFAGEHTAEIPGTLEAALESAERVVREVLRAEEN